MTPEKEQFMITPIFSSMGYERTRSNVTNYGSTIYYPSNLDEIIIVDRNYEVVEVDPLKIHLKYIKKGRF
jgi:hypothetical protein